MTMPLKICTGLLGALLSLLLPAAALAQAGLPGTPGTPGNTALINGQWFNGKAFERKQVYSVDGRFTFSKPVRIDQTLDLGGAWVVPPFADAHSHSLGLGIPGADATFAKRYLDAGVFYVQSQGNLPISAAEKAALRLNSPEGLDIAFSNGSLTSRDSGLHGVLTGMALPQGMLPGHTLKSLNNVRYFEINTAEELRTKWPLILEQKSDFIKTFLWLTDNAPLVAPPFLEGKHALSPEVFREIVRLAHASGLRVSAHVISAGDFRVAVEGGADEIAHMASAGVITPELAKLAASRRVAVVTTMGQAAGPPESIPPMLREAVPGMVAGAVRNLKTLVENGVTIVIGADTPADTSVAEAAYLQSLGLFDNAAMLRMWGTDSPLVIFPNRQIGAFKEGYEASFLALDADPLADWGATRKIRMRFKQGLLLEARPQ
jgi:imidazolonepropionase-like amidohydrolase